MILDCPSCTARFLVADALVPPGGRTVRCGACKHQWFVGLASPAATIQEVAPGFAEVSEPAAPPSPTQTATVDFATLAENAAPMPAPKLEGAAARKLPVVKKRLLPTWVFASGAGLLATSWLVLAVIAYFPSWQHSLVFTGLYKSIGAVATDGLVFEEVSMEKQKQEGRTQFILAGSIANTAAQLRRLPKVRVELRSAEGKVLWKRNYPVNQTIKAGEVFPFRIEDVQTSFGDRVTTITVDIGNSLELLVR